MYNDADYWQYKLQKQAQSSISSLEKYQSALRESSIKNRTIEYVKDIRNKNIDSNRKNIYETSDFSDSYVLPELILKSNKLTNDIYLHYEALGETELAFERLNQTSRLSNSLEKDIIFRSTQKYMNIYWLNNLTNCLVRTLNTELWNSRTDQYFNSFLHHTNKLQTYQIEIQKNHLDTIFYTIQ